MRFTRWGAVVLSTVLLVATAPAAAAPARHPFEVQLRIRDGYVAVDPDPALTVLDDDIAHSIQNVCPSLTPDRVRAELITYLDGLLRKRGPVLQQRLRDDRTGEIDALLSRDKEAADLAHGTMQWTVMADRLLRWTLANPSWVKSPEGIVPVYKTVVNDQRLADGPLILGLDDPGDASEIVPWVMKGRVPFALAAPITAEYQKVRPNANASEWSDIREDLAASILDDLRCTLWDRDRIIAMFSDYLEMRGLAVADFRTPHDVDTLVPRVDLKPAPKDRVGIAPEKPVFVDQRPARLRVIMSPDPVLAGVLMQIAPQDLATINRVLYLVLPSDDYRRVVAAPGTHLCLFTAGIGGGAASTMVLLPLRGPRADLRMSERYLTRRFLAERTRYLETLGFTAAPTLFEERLEQQGQRPVKSAYLLIAPAQAPGTPPPAGGPSPIASCADDRAGGEDARTSAPALRFDRGQDTVRPESFANESSRKDTRSRGGAPEPERPREMRVGAEYEPTRPMRYTLGYSQSSLTGPDALSAQVGMQDEPSGDLQYSRDFVLFDRLGRRLQLSLRAFSDFTPERELPSGTADERRTGGEADARLDLWRDLEGHWAQLTVRVSWRESEVQPEHGPADRTGLALLDLGLLYFKSWDGTASARRLEVQPTVTVGYADDRGDVFARIGVDARNHQFVGAFSQWETRLRAFTATGSIPDVELPSFGGADSVRGYRPDAGLARTVWAWQNEAWFPARLPWGLPAAIDTILRRNVALAVLADVGGLHDSRDTFAGVKASAGLGLRLVWQDYLTLRLDYAQAIGDRTRTRDAGLVYFTVTTRPTF